MIHFGTISEEEFLTDYWQKINHWFNNQQSMVINQWPLY